MPTGIYQRRKNLDYHSLLNPRPRKNRAVRATVVVAGKQIAISRKVMELFLNRELASEEIVHHIDEDPTNNRIENLKLVIRSEHKKLHPSIGLATRLKKIHILDEKEMMELRNRGLSFLQIGKLKGCNEITVRRFVRKIEKEKLT